MFVSVLVLELERASGIQRASERCKLCTNILTVFCDSLLFDILVHWAGLCLRIFLKMDLWILDLGGVEGHVWMDDEYAWRTTMQ